MTNFVRNVAVVGKSQGVTSVSYLSFFFWAHVNVFLFPNFVVETQKKSISRVINGY